MSDKKYLAGIDAGTSFIKAVVIDEKSEIVGSQVERTGGDLQDSINRAYQGAVNKASVTQEAIMYTIGTGFGRRNVTFANSIKTEISCHAKGAHFYFPQKITIIDIGGQDTKVIKVNEKGQRTGFRMNRKCAAGTGTFLEEIAHRLNTPLDDMNELAKKSEKTVPLSSYCTVFASSEILTRIREGDKIEDMVKNAFESVARRVIEMEAIEGTIVMTGGVVAHNDIIKEIMERHFNKEVLIPPNPQLIGAFGAALLAKEAVLGK